MNHVSYTRSHFCSSYLKDYNWARKAALQLTQWLGLKTRLRSESQTRIMQPSDALSTEQQRGPTDWCFRTRWRTLSIERQVEQAVARADNCEAKFIIQTKSRFTALKETRQVINAHKRSVKRSVHNKMKMSANAALHKVTAEKMEIGERNKRLQKALAYREKLYDHMWADLTLTHWLDVTLVNELSRVDRCCLHWWMMRLRPRLMLGWLVDVDVYTLTDAVYTWLMLSTLMDVPIHIYIEK